MDLDEMKQRLEGDAQRRVRQMEQENRHLVNVIRRKEDITKEKNRQLRVLYNRCFDTSRSNGMCFFCGLKRECERLRGTE